MVYTISEIAAKLNVAPSAIRYYDKEGLLPFVERSSGGIRVFRESDFQWLSIIDCLKKTGMPIKKIRDFIDLCMQGDSTIDGRLSLIQAQRESVAKQMKELKETMDMLDYKKWYYETAKIAGTCSVPDKMDNSEVPARFRKIRDHARGL